LQRTKQPIATGRVVWQGLELTFSAGAVAGVRRTGVVVTTGLGLARLAKASLALLAHRARLVVATATAVQPLHEADVVHAADSSTRGGTDTIRGVLARDATARDGRCDAASTLGITNVGCARVGVIAKFGVAKALPVYTAVADTTRRPVVTTAAIGRHKVAAQLVVAGVLRARIAVQANHDRAGANTSRAGIRGGAHFAVVAHAAGQWLVDTRRCAAAVGGTNVVIARYGCTYTRVQQASVGHRTSVSVVTRAGQRANHTAAALANVLCTRVVVGAGFGLAAASTRGTHVGF
jgi:hypothetical protein